MKSAAKFKGELKTVGRSGQISLGKNYAGKTLRLERFDDERIVLTPMAMIPESQLWTLSEPDRSGNERGLAWGAQTRRKETGLDTLLKRGSRKKAGRTRVPRT